MATPLHCDRTDRSYRDRAVWIADPDRPGFTRQTGRPGWTLALLTLVARALGLPPGMEGALDYLVLLWTRKRL